MMCSAAARRPARRGCWRSSCGRAGGACDRHDPASGGVVFFLAVVLLIALSNLIALRRLESYGRPRGAAPFVSILVPARDEARSIEACVRSLLEQRCPAFEVLVLDDGSTDGTGDILTRLGREDGRLRVLAGAPLPPGWLGKHWACHQLAA